MNYLHAHAFESLDERAFQMTDRLVKLLNGETNIEGLADGGLIDLDDDVEDFDLH